MKILGFAKDLGTYVDLFNFERFVQAGGPSTSESLPLNLGPLTPLWDLGGVMAEQMASEIDAQHSEINQRKLEEAKLLGLEATRKYIAATKHLPEYQKESYEIMDVSAVTADKLLLGEFTKSEELYASQRDDSDFDNNISILIRKVDDKKREGHAIYIIETIFINE